MPKTPNRYPDLLIDGDITTHGDVILDPGATVDGRDVSALGSTVDALVAGGSLDAKPAVRLATTAPGTLASSFENGDTIDGIILVTGDRILIKNQASAVENGIYTVNASGAPTRAADLDTGADASAIFVFVQQGATQADTGWVCTSDAPSAVVGTDALSFTQFTGGVALTAAPPADVTKSAASAGVASDAARADHKHNVSTATPPGTAVQIGNVAAEGTATSLARSDHAHAVAAGVPVDVTKAANAEGVAASFARSDHKHDVSTGTPGTIQVGDSAAEGVTGNLARADHRHALPAPSAPANVTKAAASAGAAATVARADHKHDVSTAAPSATAVQIGNAAAEGSATTLARSDHAHQVSAGVPVDIGTANAQGAAATFARSDHVHAHGAQTDASLHATATTLLAGFMSAADKLKLDGLTPGGGSAYWKDAVRVATTGPGTLATSFENGDTVDGVVLATGNRILIKDQASGVENGIYVVEATGAPTRASDLAAASSAAAVAVFVQEGTTNADQGFVCTSNEGAAVVGTDALSFAQFTGGGVSLTAAAPADVTKAAAAVGVSTEAARADHKHDVSTAAAGTIQVGAAAAEGAATSLARSDHTHALPAPLAPADVTKAAASAGAATTVARADHKHDVSTAAPSGTAVQIGNVAAEGTASSLARSDHSHAVSAGVPVNVTKAANAAGAAATFARSDHKHDVSTAAPPATAVQVGNVAAEGSATTLARSDHAHQVSAGVPVNVTKAANAAGAATSFARSDHKHDVSTAAPSGTAVQIGNVAAEGVATTLARSDHSHTVAAGSPVTVGTANAAGAAATFARSDHVHAHGAQTDGTLHAPATVSVAGFMSASDKQKLDALITPAFRDPKESVRVATTAAQTLATDFENGDTIDGVILATGNRILVKNQASGVENGIYVVQATGAPSRAADMPAASNAAGVSVFVEEGTVNADTGWLCTTDAPSDVVGTDALSFGKFSGTALSTTPPVDVTKAAASAGVSSEAARQDHKHDVSTAAAGAIQIGDSAAEGSATSLARSDHTHSLAAPAAPADVTKAAASAGASAAPARADHKHDVSTAAPSTIGTANSEGTATSLSRSDHVHAHGAQTDGSLHAAAVASGASGFLTGADKAKLDGIEALADVTDSTNVAAAGAVMDTDFAGTDAGFMHRTGAATYEVIKSNLSAVVPPDMLLDDSSAGYAVGSRWIDVNADIEYVCLDASIGAAIWVNTTAGIDIKDEGGFLAGGPKGAINFVGSAIEAVDAGGGEATVTVDVPGLAEARWKQPVRVATAAAGTLATDFENGDTVDGVVLATGNRILIKNQASATENGIYVVQATGAPTRATDLPAAANAASVAVFVQEGTANADTGWVCTANAGADVVGTDTLAFTEFTGGGGGISASDNVNWTGDHDFQSGFKVTGSTVGTVNGEFWQAAGKVYVYSGGAAKELGVGGGASSPYSGNWNPTPSSTYDLGTTALMWRDLWCTGVRANKSTAGTLTVGTGNANRGILSLAMADADHTATFGGAGASAFAPLMSVNISGTGYATAQATGGGAVLLGQVFSANTALAGQCGMYSSGVGSFVAGYATGVLSDPAKMYSTAAGSFCAGKATGANFLGAGSSTLRASGGGSFVSGYGYNGNITASANGAFAGGSAGAVGVDITASANGAFAHGYSTSVDIIASAANAQQFGPGTNNQADSLSVGTGMRLKGTTGAPATPRNGDMWVNSGYVYVRTNGISVKISGSTNPL